MLLPSYNLLVAYVTEFWTYVWDVDAILVEADSLETCEENTYCPRYYFGDDYCDEDCNNEVCLYDGGDCAD